MNNDTILALNTKNDYFLYVKKLTFSINIVYYMRTKILK